MRIVCFTALVLIAFEASCSFTIFKSNTYKECCVPDVHRLSWKKILNYTETYDICKPKAFIVFVKEGPQNHRKLCADATKRPVIKAIEEYNKNRKSKLYKQLVKYQQNID